MPQFQKSAFFDLRQKCLPQRISRYTPPSKRHLRGNTNPFCKPSTPLPCHRYSSLRSGAILSLPQPHLQQPWPSVHLRWQTCSGRKVKAVTILRPFHLRAFRMTALTRPAHKVRNLSFLVPSPLFRGSAQLAPRLGLHSQQQGIKDARCSSAPCLQGSGVCKHERAQCLQEAFANNSLSQTTNACSAMVHSISPDTEVVKELPHAYGSR